nr:hypothetical protein [Pseudomonadota bacterium]
ALIVAFLFVPMWAGGAGLILNEYNAVGDRTFLDGGNATQDLRDGAKADEKLGRVSGNGGDWFELVVIEDGLDLRGYRLQIVEVGHSESRELVFSQHEAGKGHR